VVLIKPRDSEILALGSPRALALWIFQAKGLRASSLTQQNRLPNLYRWGAVKWGSLYQQVKKAYRVCWPMR
jgi:hypothetical protein